MLSRIPIRVLSALMLGLAPAAPSLSAQQPIGALATPPAGCMEDDPRVEVLLLGSYHMANPGQDAFNLEADDVLTPARQAEVAALVDRLATFRPTAVAIEAEYADSAEWQNAYDAYRAGERELLRNEREQIGFRLAAALDHERIHPIDVMQRLNNDAVREVVGLNPAHGRRLGELQEFGEGAVRMMAAWLSEGSISDMLYRMNQPATLELAHQPYARWFIPIVEGERYAGADLVASWYQRNLRIMANLHRTIDERDERILVVYGQGHIPLLRQFTREAPGLCLVDPLPYLID